MSDLVVVVDGEERTLELEVPRPGMGPAELISLWLAGLPSPRSRRAYAGALRYFSEALGCDPPTATTALLSSRVEAQTLVEGYRARMMETLSPASVNQRLAALRSLVRYAHRLGLVEYVLDVPGVRSRAYRDTKGPGMGGFVKLLKVATQARDKAILWLLFGLGLRRIEVAELDREDVDLEGGKVWIRGKGHQDKESLSLPAEVSEALRGWIEARGNTPGALFLRRDNASQGSQRLSGRSIARLVSKLGKLAGIRAWPHGLRHAAVTEVLDRTDVRTAQRFSRHANLKTLQRYDDNLSDLGGKAASVLTAAAALEAAKSS
ncbi:MAG: tyrosine-type recombinase/integrase [Polyangiaceae bacterium]